MIPRYSRPEMVAIWSPETRFRIWFEIEAYACDALAELGVIPKEAAKTIWEKGGAAKFDVEAIDEIERVTKHDVIAFLTHLGEFVGPDARFFPTLVTSYRRGTLFLPATASRVTIDTDLSWYDGRQRLRLPELAIVETKTSSTPSGTDRQLWRRGHRPVRISKYCTGLAALRQDLPAWRWHRVLCRYFSRADRIAPSPCAPGPSAAVDPHGLFAAVDPPGDRAGGT